MSFGIRHLGERSARASYTWHGTGKVFGDLIEWRIDAGRPDVCCLENLAHFN